MYGEEEPKDKLADYIGEVKPGKREREGEVRGVDTLHPA